MSPAPNPLRLRRLPKDLRPLARQARQAGWHLSCTASGHSRWRAPSGTIIHVSSTPGDPDMPKIVRRLLQRAGLQV